MADDININTPDDAALPGNETDRELPPPTAPAATDAHDRPHATLKGPPGRRMDFTVLLANENPIRRLRILCSLNFMIAYMEYERVRPDHHVTPTELRDLLREAGIVFGIDEDALLFLADRINQGHAPEGLLQVARGQRPRPGADGRITYLVKPTVRKARYEADTAGNIDYRSLHLFENAYANQEVAQLLPPEKGTPGRNILGASTSAEDGRPVRVRIGRGITVDESGMHFFANFDGRLEVERNRLTMEPEYHVVGNVDYRVGTIDFVGKVTITGSVLDEFHVTGAKGVTINGAVGQCRITSEGDITISGGVTGKRAAAIIAGGEVHARYLNDVTVEAGGDVYIQREIVGSVVRTAGRLHMPEGTLIGGMVSATHGVQVGSIGSKLGVQTLVAAGISWQSKSTVEMLSRAVQDIQEQMEPVRKNLAELREDRPRFVRLTAAELKSLHTLIEEMRLLRNVIAAAHEQLSSLSRTEAARLTSQVNINSSLHNSVLLRFPTTNIATQAAYRGPLTVLEDRVRKLARIIEQVPLREDHERDGQKIARLRDLPARRE